VFVVQSSSRVSDRNRGGQTIQLYTMVFYPCLPHKTPVILSARDNGKQHVLMRLIYQKLSM